MSLDSKIQWTDHTWNIAVGCSKVDSDCKYCYMFRGSLNEKRYNPKVVRKTKTVFKLPLKIKEPSKIFTSSLTDVFHPDCDKFRNEMWDIIRQCPQHTFQILTKRPERIIEQTPKDILLLTNIWWGTSVGNKDGMSRALDLSTLHSQTNGLLFLSIEPLHTSLNINPWIIDICHQDNDGDGVEFIKAFDWIIVGGESGNENGKYKYRPCKLEWIEAIIDECLAYDIPIFVKQLGTHLAKEMKLKDRHGGDITEWPEHLKIREFPKSINI